MKLADLITKFESYLLTEKRVSKNTFMAYKQDLWQFAQFIEKEGYNALDQVQTSVLRDFLAHLRDIHLSIRSIARKIATLKGFYIYAAQFKIPNRAQELAMPRLPQKLPEYLTEQEVEQLFDVVSRDTSPNGKRNRVMFYTMYVTGMRVSELVNLQVANVQYDTECIRVDGKGGKQRMIPIPKSDAYYVSNVY